MNESWKRLLKKGLLLLGAGIVLLGTAGYFFGEDLLWSALRPDHTDLIGEQGVPAGLPGEAWREDLRYLGRELPGRLSRFHEAVDSAAFNRKIDSAVEAVSGLGRPERILEIMKMMNLPLNPGYGGGHTLLPPFQRPLDWGFYPFYPYHFEDGVWVVLSAGAAVDARGSEILEMNGFPIERVLELGRPYVSADNRYSLRDRLAGHLFYAGFLKGLGVVPEEGTLELLLRRPNNETFNINLRPSELFSFGGMQWGRTLQQSVETWSPADPRPRNENYYFEYRDNSRLLYFQFNRVANKEGESISEFAERMKAFADRHAIERFVIDLRSNGGGDNQLLEPLLSLVSGYPKINRRGVLYTLIGRRTFSAAGSFAAALERRTKTIFAGEPSGFSPSHLGDSITIPLPRSRVLVNISSRYWADDGPFGSRPWIEPDLSVTLSSGDHFSDRDPVLEAVLEHIPEESAPVTLSGNRLEALREELPGRYRFGEFKVLEIRNRESGLPEFVIRGVGTWAGSAIYPLKGEGTRFATDMNGVFLEIGGEGDMRIDWRGTVRTLPEMQPGERTPLELLRGLMMQEEDVSVDSVVVAFRKPAAAGSLPDSHTEFLLNRTGYELLWNGRMEDAVNIFGLQAELYPTVANAFDSLGEGYLAAGKTEKAREAFMRALELNPGFDHPRRMLEEMER